MEFRFMEQKNQGLNIMSSGKKVSRRLVLKHKGLQIRKTILIFNMIFDYFFFNYLIMFM